MAVLRDFHIVEIREQYRQKRSGFRTPVCMGRFLGVGREESERLVRTLRVVVRDIIADGLIERRDRVRIAAVELLLLERREERLHDGIVCRRMRTRVGDVHAVFAAELAHGHRRVGRPTVGMEDDVLWGRALLAGGAKRQQNEVGAVAHGDAVGDGLARIEIENDADEVAMLLELELRDVAGPDHVWCSRVEVALDEVRESWLLLEEYLLRRAADTFQPHCPHELANLLLGDGRSILPDDRGNLRRAEDLVVLLEDALDLLAELPVANRIDAVLALAAVDVV